MEGIGFCTSVGLNRPCCGLRLREIWGLGWGAGFEVRDLAFGVQSLGFSV